MTVPNSVCIDCGEKLSAANAKHWHSTGMPYLTQTDGAKGALCYECLVLRREEDGQCSEDIIAEFCG